MAAATTGLREQTVQDHVAGVCAALGIAHYHTKDSRGSDRGFLDSFCIGPGGARILEAKDDTGTMTAEQKLWARLFVEILEIPVLLVRPVDARPSQALGGKTRIQVELEQIARDPAGNRFPRDIADGIVAAREAKVRQALAAVRRATASRRSR